MSCLMQHISKSMCVTNIEPSARFRTTQSEPRPPINYTAAAPVTHPLIEQISRKAVEKTLLDVDFFALGTIVTVA